MNSRNADTITNNINTTLDDVIIEGETQDGAFLGYDKLSLGRHMLPIAHSKLEILYSIEKFSCTIIIAETGSGKTTQIPQYLVESGYTLDNKCIAITQPRRMAAISVAKRVAEEMDCTLGIEVGYHIRFDDKSTDRTLIKYLTDGMLLREMMQDPLLQKYSVIMVDDIHERNIYTDIILGLLKKIRRKRPELKIIVSSATLEANIISDYFTDTKHNFESHIIHVEGRQYPVDIFYLKTPCKNYVMKAAELALDIHYKRPDGDILVFLTGQEEIETFIEIISEIAKNDKTEKKLLCLPLYGTLSMEAQMAIFSPAPNKTRKLIVSTNIAESSVTINGIVYVIDSCFIKQKFYDYTKGTDSLIITPISKSSGNQRAGRAGRVKAGECYRLCTKEEFEVLPSNGSPEISRTNLASVFLQMKSLGVANLMNFEYLTKPPEEAIVRALELLYSLKAINIDGDLTQDVGWKIADIPIDPRLAVILINSGKEEFACSKEIMMLVACLSVQNIYHTSKESSAIIKSKKKLGAKEGDHITLINIFIRYDYIRSKNDRKSYCSQFGLNERSLIAAHKIYNHLEKMLKRLKIPITASDDEPDNILKCILIGFFDRVAQRQADGSYRGVRSKELLYLHPHSILNAVFPEWVVYNEIVRTGKAYMREVSQIDYKWLLEIAPHFYEDNKVKIHEARHKKEMEEYDELANRGLQKKVKIAGPSSADNAMFKPTFVSKTKPKFTISDMDYDNV